MGTGNLLYWALIFLIVALVAGVFGFGGVAAGAESIGRIIFYVAIILLLISLVLNFTRR